MERCPSFAFFSGLGPTMKPETVAQIEFLEWTEGDRLRHSKFAGLREDKNARSVVKEKIAEL